MQREEVSAVIVVGNGKKRASESYGARGKKLYCIKDMAAAIENIMLTPARWAWANVGLAFSRRMK